MLLGDNNKQRESLIRVTVVRKWKTANGSACVIICHCFTVRRVHACSPDKRWFIPWSEIIPRILIPEVCSQQKKFEDVGKCWKAWTSNRPIPLHDFPRSLLHANYLDRCTVDMGHARVTSKHWAVYVGHGYSVNHYVTTSCMPKSNVPGNVPRMKRNTRD